MLSLSQYFRKGSVISAIKLTNPAPSKLSFLLSRFWLRKRYKFAVISMVFLSIFWFLFHFSFSQIKVHETFLKSFENLKAGVLGRPEFTINGILVRVDNEILKQKIIKVINIQVPVSSLTLNLEDTRKKIEKLAGIKNAAVSIDNYGKLIITVSERLPAIINKVGSKYFLLDKDGLLVNEIMSRFERPDLPLFIGQGMEGKVQEGLKILIGFAPYTARVNALTWVGNRRWNILFDKERIIKLPSHDPLGSIERLINLDIEFRFLSSDVLQIDLRNEKFLILQPNLDNQNSRNIQKYPIGEGA